MQTDLLAGRQIDDYTVQKRIGRGGMAAVYSAYQASVHREVALKIISLDPGHSTSEEFRQRFALEAKVIAGLEHLHVLPIYDYGIINDELAYIAMRLLRGGSLSTLLGTGQLTQERIADILTQIARGLTYAHSRGVIHRDLKPSNILLDETGNAYLTDFGLAKLVEDSLELTRSGHIVGTPTYMAPEQLRGDPLDHRSDIYSLGVILYHMLVGRPPFDSTESNMVSMIYQHLERLPIPPRQLVPEISSEIEFIVLKALSKDPADRFDTADELADAFNLALGRTVSSTSQPALRPVKPRTDAPSIPYGRTPTDPQFAAAPPVDHETHLDTISAVRAVLRSRRPTVWVGVLAALIIGVAGLGFVLTQANRPVIFPAATVLINAQGSAGDALPTANEIAVAQQRLGADGFLAYSACNRTSEYHARQAREMSEFAAGYGLRLEIYDSENDAYRQITQIERARTDGAHLLIVCPLNYALLDETLSAVPADELPLVFMSSQIPSYGGVLLGGDDYLMGRASGEAVGAIIAAEWQGEADVVILDFPDMPFITQRADGLRDGIKALAPNVNIIGRYLGGTRENGEQSIRQLLADGVGFEAILSINDAGAYGAVRALEDAQVAPGDVIIGSVDAEALARSYILDGYFFRVSVDAGREQFSRTAIDVAVKLLAGATVPELYLVPPGDVITRDTLIAQGTAD
ncbi:MAG: protein kinase [Chloroflexi bacterium]|nr:protein kinase [Chloroflexota bacterium]